MRPARVLLPSSPAPRLALERDGCLYDVAELERRRIERAAPRGALRHRRRFFHARLRRRWRRARRPGRCALRRRAPHRGEALPRRAPLAPALRTRARAPRAARSHSGGRGASVPPRQPARIVGAPRVGPLSAERGSARRRDSIAALLGDELRAATPSEAERAILGFTILLGWVARQHERTSGSPTGARDFAATLGPVLVTKDEAGSLDEARVRLRIGGGVGQDSPRPLLRRFRSPSRSRSSAVTSR